jgi:hypothetical protein
MTKQMALPIMPANIEDLYIDQAMCSGEGFFSAYTPWGIKQLDSNYSRRIMNLARDPEEVRAEIFNNEFLRESEKEEQLQYLGESPEALENDIYSDEHLHPCIIENLIGNLNRVKKENELSRGRYNILRNDNVA